MFPSNPGFSLRNFKMGCAVVARNATTHSGTPFIADFFFGLLCPGAEKTMMGEEGLPFVLRALVSSRATLEQRVHELQAHVESLEGRVRTVEGRGDPISYDNLLKAAKAVRKRAREDQGYCEHIERHYPGGSEDPPRNIPGAYLLEFGFIELEHELESARAVAESEQRARREAVEGHEFEIRKKMAVIDDMQKQRTELAREIQRIKTEAERAQSDTQRIRRERDALYMDKKALSSDLQHAQSEHAAALESKIRKLQKDIFAALRHRDISPDAPVYKDLEKIFA
jgi:hypothetical protein